MTGAREERLYSLDAARALAALIVVFQHWEHFLSLPAYSAAKQDSPFYVLFAPLYEHGARAVTFFFCLSGFIFYWLYSRKIRDGSVGPATFAVLRLSRLYPLHLATLLACVALQWPIVQLLGHTFIYGNHDAGHFALNLLLVQYWGFENGYSFNGPTWSVSVEIFLYIAFFLACRLVRPSVWQCLALALVAVFLARYSALAAAAVTFFLGGAAFYAYRALAARWTPLRNLALAALVAGLWMIIPPLIDQNVLPGLLAQLRPMLGDGRPGDLVLQGLRVLAERQFEFVLFPATVVALALSEVAWRRIPWAWLHTLGNMSYGIYLLHFPLQLAFVCVALAFPLPADVFVRGETLALFFALLLAVSAVSYFFFEKPAMAAIRGVWKRRSRRDNRAAPEVPVPVVDS